MHAGLPLWLAAGELSWFHLIIPLVIPVIVPLIVPLVVLLVVLLVIPKMLFLIPLVRFPGLVGLMGLADRGIGFLLPGTPPLPPPS